MSLRLALPSEGALFEGAAQFMASCGLRVSRASSRRYTATVPALPGVGVLFQRQSDITSEIDGESADIGIVGLDRYRESRREGGDTLLILDDLGFRRRQPGACRARRVGGRYERLRSCGPCAGVQKSGQGTARGHQVSTPREAIPQPAGNQLLFPGPRIRGPGSGADHGLCGHNCRHLRHWSHTSGKPPEAPIGRNGNRFTGGPGRQRPVAGRRTRLGWR